MPVFRLGEPFARGFEWIRERIVGRDEDEEREEAERRAREEAARRAREEELRRRSGGDFIDYLRKTFGRMPTFGILGGRVRDIGSEFQEIRKAASRIVKGDIGAVGELAERTLKVPGRFVRETVGRPTRELFDTLDQLVGGSVIEASLMNVPPERRPSWAYDLNVRRWVGTAILSLTAPPTLARRLPYSLFLGSVTDVVDLARSVGKLATSLGRAIPRVARAVTATSTDALESAKGVAQELVTEAEWRQPDGTITRVKRFSIHDIDKDIAEAVKNRRHLERRIRKGQAPLEATKAIDAHLEKLHTVRQGLVALGMEEVWLPETVDVRDFMQKASDYASEMRELVTTETQRLKILEEANAAERAQRMIPGVKVAAAAKPITVSQLWRALRSMPEVAEIDIAAQEVRRWSEEAQRARESLDVIDRIIREAEVPKPPSLPRWTATAFSPQDVAKVKGQRKALEEMFNALREVAPEDELASLHAKLEEVRAREEGLELSFLEAIEPPRLAEARQLLAYVEGALTNVVKGDPNALRRLIRILDTEHSRLQDALKVAPDEGKQAIHEALQRNRHVREALIRGIKESSTLEDFARFRDWLQELVHAWEAEIYRPENVDPKLLQKPERPRISPRLAGRVTEAMSTLQQAVEAYRTQGDTVALDKALSLFEGPGRAGRSRQARELLDMAAEMRLQGRDVSEIAQMLEGRRMMPGPQWLPYAEMRALLKRASQAEEQFRALGEAAPQEALDELMRTREEIAQELLQQAERTYEGQLHKALQGQPAAAAPVEEEPDWYRARLAATWRHIVEEWSEKYRRAAMNAAGRAQLKEHLRIAVRLQTSAEKRLRQAIAKASQAVRRRYGRWIFHADTEEGSVFYRLEGITLEGDGPRLVFRRLGDVREEALEELARQKAAEFRTLEEWRARLEAVKSELRELQKEFRDRLGKIRQEIVARQRSLGTTLETAEQRVELEGLLKDVEAAFTTARAHPPADWIEARSPGIKALWERIQALRQERDMLELARPAAGRTHPDVVKAVLEEFPTPETLSKAIADAQERLKAARANARNAAARLTRLRKEHDKASRALQEAEQAAQQGDESAQAQLDALRQRYQELSEALRNASEQATDAKAKLLQAQQEWERLLEAERVLRQDPAYATAIGAPTALLRPDSLQALTPIKLQITKVPSPEHVPPQARRMYERLQLAVEMHDQALAAYAGTMKTLRRVVDDFMALAQRHSFPEHLRDVIRSLDATVPRAHGSDYQFKRALQALRGDYGSAVQQLASSASQVPLSAQNTYRSLLRQLTRLSHQAAGQRAAWEQTWQQLEDLEAQLAEQLSSPLSAHVRAQKAREAAARLEENAAYHRTRIETLRQEIAKMIVPPGTLRRLEDGRYIFEGESPSTMAAMRAREAERFFDLMMGRIVPAALKANEPEKAARQMWEAIFRDIQDKALYRGNNALVERIRIAADRASVAELLRPLLAPITMVAEQLDVGARSPGLARAIRIYALGHGLRSSSMERVVKELHRAEAAASVMVKGTFVELYRAAVEALSDFLSKHERWKDVASLSDPHKRMRAYLQRMAKPPDDPAWQQIWELYSNIGEQYALTEDEIRYLHSIMSQDFVVAARHPELFNFGRDFNRLPQGVREAMRAYHRSLLALEATAKIVLGVDEYPALYLVKADVRDRIGPRGLAFPRPGSKEPPKPLPLNHIALAYIETMRRLEHGELGEFRGQVYRVTRGAEKGPAKLPLSLDAVLVAPHEMVEAVPAAFLQRAIREEFYRTAAQMFLKDPSRVGALKTGQVNRADFVEHLKEASRDDLWADWQKVVGILSENVPGPPLHQVINWARRSLGALTASILGLDLSILGIQGWTLLLASPRTFFRALNSLVRHRNILADDVQFAAYIAANYDVIVPLVRRGLGVGIESFISGAEANRLLWQNIPFTRKIGNLMAFMNKVLFDRALLMLKVEAAKTYLDMAQLLRAAPRNAALRVLQTVPRGTFFGDTPTEVLLDGTEQEVVDAVVRFINRQLGGMPRSQALTGGVRNVLEHMLFLVPGFTKAQIGKYMQPLIGLKDLRQLDAAGIEAWLHTMLLARELGFAMTLAAGLTAMGYALGAGFEGKGPKDILAMAKEGLEDWFDDDTFDPRSPKFGSIRLPSGDTITLIPSGWVPRVLGSFVAPKYASPADVQARIQTIRRWVEGRASPLVQQIVMQVRGTDFLGNSRESLKERAVWGIMELVPIIGQEVAEMVDDVIHGLPIDRGELAVRPLASLLGRNYLVANPIEHLEARFQQWQKERFPEIASGERKPLSWFEAPQELRDEARKDPRIAEAAEVWERDRQRSIHGREKAIDLAFRRFEGQMKALDEQLRILSRQAEAGQITFADWLEGYRRIQAQRAAYAQALREELIMYGLDIEEARKKRLEKLQVGGKGPLVALALTEYESVKMPMAERVLPDGTVVEEPDIELYEAQRMMVLSRYPKHVQEEVKRLTTPDDPMVQRYKRAREALDNYFRIPKYRGLSAEDAQYVDATITLLRRMEEMVRESGVRGVPRRVIYIAALRKARQDGWIKTRREARLAILAVAFALDSELRLAARTPESIAYLIRNPDIIRFFPWMESEVPVRLRMLLPRDVRARLDYEELRERVERAAPPPVEALASVR